METLRPGATGEAVEILQNQLKNAGYLIFGEPGIYGPQTESAVRLFQTRRGLRVDGLCGKQTWSALEETAHRLGSRQLGYEQPMLRGDDVTELQRRLNRLGFDAGREDGILGRQTAHAIGEFQRNAGISPDGIAGPATLVAIDRVDSLADGAIASVREAEQLRRGDRRLAGSTVHISSMPGLAEVAQSVSVALLNSGAVTGALITDDERQAASAANRADADLAFTLWEADFLSIAYFGNAGFSSPTGEHLARSLQQALRGWGVGGAEGKAFQFLRETRMPAVALDIPVGLASTPLGVAIAGGIRRAFSE